MRKKISVCHPSSLRICISFSYSPSQPLCVLCLFLPLPAFVYFAFLQITKQLYKQDLRDKCCKAHFVKMVRFCHRIFNRKNSSTPFKRIDNRCYLQMRKKERFTHIYPYPHPPHPVSLSTHLTHQHHHHPPPPTHTHTTTTNHHHHHQPPPSSPPPTHHHLRPSQMFTVYIICFPPSGG